MVLVLAQSPHSERHLSPGDPMHDRLRLQQTLARSPSKFRIFSSRHSSPSTSPQAIQSDTFPPQSLFPVSAKKRKQLPRVMSPLRLSRGSAASQRQFPRRPLQESADHGNSSLQSMTLATSPDNMQISPDENMLAPHHAISRNSKSGYFDIQKSSPLKRAEPNSDFAVTSSPSAKRRSLHGANFVMPEFNMMEPDGISEDGDLLTPTPQYSPIQRRSLRRAKLTSQFDTLPPIRSRPTVGNIYDIQAAKARNRLSLDCLPSPDKNNDSPFAFDSTTQQPKELPTLGKLTLPTASSGHPLMQSMTQSSSSDVAEDSPTHAPLRTSNHGSSRGTMDAPTFHLGGFRKPFPIQNFSRSLPVGAARPTDSADGSSYATPAAHKIAKPHPAPFRSTGLVSKRNHYVPKEQMDDATGISDMPDTPCKRSFAVGGPVPIPTPNINLLKSRGARQTLPAFGTPSTPFGPAKSTSIVSYTPASVFGSTFNQGPMRRGSFADTIEEAPKSPLLNFRNRHSTAFEMPPTPTKPSPAQFVMPDSNPSSRRNSADPEFAIMDSKSTFLPDTSGARGGEIDASCLSSPSPKLRFRDPNALPSFSKSIARGKMRRPSPLSNLSTPTSSNKTKTLLLASPYGLPVTPLETVDPPDPSSLSISGHVEQGSFFRRPSFNDSLTVNQPATPTAARDSFGKSSFGISVTPSHQHAAPVQLDDSLIRRFNKVEALDKGEFSQVWKVYKYKHRDGSDVSPKRNSRDHSRQVKVYAVKKAKNPYLGPRDRAQKMQEVQILRALGQHAHTVQFFDYWEHQDHLYIQTEFCEEGTLASFLARVGNCARLDDFRIWKILLEMAEGLKHIHDSGFIHLDIKPANVLVTFEGILKIGDFGMASTWPAPAHIDGEGDRQYISPESLTGKFDKPTDIFSLGLMMVEIGGNVELPHHGTAWQKLRSGDTTDVPSLTSSSDITNISRDSSGDPIDNLGRKITPVINTSSTWASFNFGFDEAKPHRLGELRTAPVFMTDEHDPGALNHVVDWMITPTPTNRPVIDQVLRCEGVKWVAARRRAGATIYEGNYGPADEILNHDSEMIDV